MIGRIVITPVVLLLLLFPSVLPASEIPHEIAGFTLGADITDYRALPVNQTINGLDKRFGAGQVNIYNSFHIVAAGEQGSAWVGTSDRTHVQSAPSWITAVAASVLNCSTATSRRYPVRSTKNGLEL